MLTARQPRHQPLEKPRRLDLDGDCHLELLPPAPYETAYLPAQPVIGFGFDAQTGMHAFASSQRTAFAARPNHLSWVPAGCEVYSQSGKGGEYLRICIGNPLADVSLSQRQFSNVIDPAAIRAAGRLRRMLMPGGAADPIRCEAEIDALTERVAATLGGHRETPAEARWMTPRRLRMIEQIIEARLAEKLTVHELAAGLGLSSGFFSRAFKAAVGKSPHDHIIDRRIARARALLPDRELGLAHIAQETGFSSHAHMTAMFTERLGIGPARIRRDRLD